MQIDNHLHMVVIAGGSGTRFWPLSRKHHPKQLLQLLGNETLLHRTLLRLQPLIPKERWWLVVGKAHAAGCRQAVPEMAVERLLVEPLAKNTAPAIALAALHSHMEDPHSTLAIFPADHHVKQEETFRQAIVEASLIAQKGAMVTLGIKPTYPETGYGYIELGKNYASHTQAFHVNRFREKPPLAQAQAFVTSGKFLWNAGIFVMSSACYLQALKDYLPTVYAPLMVLRQHYEQTAGKGVAYEKALQHYYQQVPSISIDYGIMEKSQHVVVIPVDCGWSDVGSFQALETVLPQDSTGNVSVGKNIVIDSQNCVVYGDKHHLLAVYGMDDVAVIHTEDATLVLPKSKSQDVRKIIARLEELTWQEYLD